MYKPMTRAEFLLRIKNLDDRLKNIKLSSVQIEKEKKEISFDFICDKPIDQELKDKILDCAMEITPPIFKGVSVSVKKIVSSPDLVGMEIYKYVADNYPSLSIFLKPTDILTSVVGEVVKFTVRLTADGVEYAKKCGLLKKLDEFLATKFCSEFVGNFDVKEADETFSLLSDDVYESQVQKIEHRTIKVLDLIAIDDPSMDNTALYIEDAVDGSVTVCGRITEITEKETKNGKPFFIIHIDDTTGKMNGVYFTKKNTLNKIRELAVDDCIIADGVVGEYNGRKSFTFNKINRCTFPKDFVKKDKYKKTAPTEYKIIFPSPITTVKVKSVFDKEVALPTELIEKTFVVFDLETTGIDVMNNGITEIGAVKIKDGKMIEKFTSLIKPDYPISNEITKLTGIDEDMVKDAPKIGTVIPDFMKFIDKCTLVGHNVEFDLKFIKRFASAEEYDINNPVMDTLALAKEKIRTLKHYDLHTVADYFGVIFQHHRALSDAQATAEVFIELMKMKK